MRSVDTPSKGVSYRGQGHPYREIVIEQLKQGVSSSVLSAKYGINMSTIAYWIKELPKDAVPTKYQYRNKQISIMRKVNQVQAKIMDALSEYIVCDITDKEWEYLQMKIQRELIILATDDERTRIDQLKKLSETK